MSLLIDNLTSINVDMRLWPKRTGLLKVEQRGEAGTQYSIPASRHIANEPGQPEWPQFRFSNGEIAGTVIAIAVALPSVILLGWSIIEGVLL